MSEDLRHAGKKKVSILYVFMVMQIKLVVVDCGILFFPNNPFSSGWKKM